MRSLVLLAALVAGAVHAQTYYVSPKGADTNDGGFAAPWRTIQKAADSVRAGDTIEVMAGTYREHVRVGGYAQKHIGIGRPGAWITLKPYRHDKVKLVYYDPRFHGDMDKINPTTLWFFPVYCNATGNPKDCVPVYWVVKGIDISGGPLYNVKIEAPKVKLIGNKIHGSGADAVKLVQTANDVLIEGNEIYDTAHPPKKGSGKLPNAQAIDIVGADRTIVRDNDIHDINSVGMFAKGNAHDTVFENNRLRRIFGRAIQLGQSTDKELLTRGPYESYNGIVRDNLIEDSGDACLAVASSYGARIYGNRCVNVMGRTDDPSLTPRAAIYVAMESEVNQPNTDIDIHDNIVVMAPNAVRPVIQIARDAMTDPKTLHINHNVYWHPRGPAAVTFSWDQRALYDVSFTQWKARTRLDLTSRIARPRLAVVSRSPFARLARGTD